MQYINTDDDIFKKNGRVQHMLKKIAQKMFVRYLLYINFDFKIIVIVFLGFLTKKTNIILSRSRVYREVECNKRIQNCQVF